MSTRTLKNIWVSAVAAFPLSMALVVISGDRLSAGETPDLPPYLVGQRQFNAIQRVYEGGVPHTDKNGRVRLDYDPAVSFFPVGMLWTPADADWQEIKDIGCNTAWPWATYPVADQLEQGRKLGLQVVSPMAQGTWTDEVMKASGDHPNLLGACWYDEPIGRLGSVDMDAFFAEYLDFKRRFEAAHPDALVFINDSPWIMPPATSWWVKWNTSSRVSCHDNYPVMTSKHLARSLGADPNGIPQTIAFAAAANQEKQPVWFIVGAFGWRVPPDGAHPFRMPTPDQLRAQVYAALVHGATGIHYFAWDNYVSRNGIVYGMAADPQPVYAADGLRTVMTPMEQVMSRALWDAARQINTELAALAPSLLSPTVRAAELDVTAEMEGPQVTTAPLRALLKPHADGGYALLTVNLDDAAIKTSWTFSKPVGRAELLFENREDALEVGEDGKTVTLWYEPFAVHVIRVVPGDAPVAE